MARQELRVGLCPCDLVDAELGPQQLVAPGLVELVVLSLVGVAEDAFEYLNQLRL
jgi:hypothetical protein